MASYCGYHWYHVWTSFVCVNDFRLKLCVSVSVNVKSFKFTLCRKLYLSVSVNVKINTWFIWFYATMQNNVNVKQMHLYVFYMTM
jgi:hypothetical protein